MRSNMPKIFISYRRDDAAYPAHSIYDNLVAQFGRDSVVFDVDTIPWGIDFREYLNDAVGRCDLLLAVIGDHWLELRGADGRPRLHQAADFVRIEIQAALKRKIPVIPVLVGRALMPSKDDLPRGLKSLSYRNAAQVRPGRDFQHHLDQLVRDVDGLLRTSDVAEPERPATIANSIDLNLVVIPAGEFLMGSPDSETGIPDDEKPQHRVRITKPFYLAAHPVTQQQYERVVGENPSCYTGDGRRPVEEVTWIDAINFCNQLSKQEVLTPCYTINGEQVSRIDGTGYRLPSEAEWEYACRAGTTTKWTFGDEPSGLGRYAWCSHNLDGETHPVGGKEPNRWGVYDAYGNVWEWCWDWYAADYYSDSPDSDPSGPTSGARRALRGGSIEDVANYVRSACRGPDWLPDGRYHTLGFRVARTYR